MLTSELVSRFVTKKEMYWYRNWHFASRRQSYLIYVWRNPILEHHLRIADVVKFNAEGISSLYRNQYTMTRESDILGSCGAINLSRSVVRRNCYNPTVDIFGVKQQLSLSSTSIELRYCVGISIPEGKDLDLILLNFQTDIVCCTQELVQSK